MTKTLTGLVVIVTRPAHQAGPFLRMLGEQGAAAVAFPTIAIEPLSIDADRRRELSPDQFDWTIYTSANAVELSLAPLGQPQRTRVAAIGRATSRALSEHGIRVDATPMHGSDSEALLAQPEFAALHGLRVLIVKGVGGRDVLRVRLTERGAHVALAEVYRRAPVAPSATAFDELRRACEALSPVAAVTSVEVLESLLKLTPEAALPRLRDADLLLPGERVAAAARRLGWRGRLIVAPSAEDSVMLQALLNHRGRGGGDGPA